MDMPEAMSRVVAASGLDLVDWHDLPSRKARRSPVPAALEPAVRAHLCARFPDGLYAHQSLAIERSLAGEDVCLATGTASGKSLVYLAAAADALRRDPEARVLALYPVRALLQDQAEKWASILGPLGLSVAQIDGSVTTDRRASMLRSARVVLMTPDVLHAWLMSHLQQREVAAFLRGLRLLVLDEAHVYEGVFGTNAAYLLRRLQAATSGLQMVLSTATAGDVGDFTAQLTGRTVRVIGPAEDGSAAAPRSVLLASPPRRKAFSQLAALLANTARAGVGRFLAFADSRQMVEKLVIVSRRAQQAASVPAGDTLGETAVQTESQASAGPEEDACDELGALEAFAGKILPYRSGYEPEDRSAIQRALASGELAGVVSTSALELGIDIGDIDVVLLLGMPPSMKSLWQRLGRAGRRNPAACVLVDSEGALGDHPGALAKVLERPMEPAHLYLENRYLEYANVLCAAQEIADQGGRARSPAAFETLPASFRESLANELCPTANVPAELYPLKQAAQGGPHREFALRCGIERNFQVVGPMGARLGSLTFAQALREAYPGAVYLYMARSYRVTSFDYRRGEIFVRKERQLRTRPTLQTMVFPDFRAGVRSLHAGGGGFLAEAEVQVSQRVTGFREQRGAGSQEHVYQPGSPYSQRDLQRYFRTTGVCWFLPERATLAEGVASRVVRAFCRLFGVHERDVGVGLFHAQRAPLGEGRCQGICVFDATYGSLRLTERLGAHFAEVVSEARAASEADGDAEAMALAALERWAMALRVQQLVPAASERASASTAGADANGGEASGGVLEVVAPGEQAVFAGNDGHQVVTVKRCVFTPQGLQYELVGPDPRVRWMVPARGLQPLHGATRMARFNLATGELESDEAAAA